MVFSAIVKMRCCCGWPLRLSRLVGLGTVGHADFLDLLAVT